VETYTFDTLLTAGTRDSASGTFSWEASLPHPGRYFLRCFLHWKTPTGELRGMNGNGHLYIIGPDDVSNQPRRGEMPFQD
jgi:hypothetical protein